MSSPWTDLLFLHGHIHDPALARQLARSRTNVKPTPKAGKRIKPKPEVGAQNRRLAGLWQHFALLPQLR